VLEFGPRDVVLTWANEVVAAHPERRVIVLTHAHLYPDDTLQGAPEHQGNPTANGRQNNGTHVWEKLLRRHANIAFVFNGHSVILPNAGVPGQEDQVGRLVGVGDAGNRIFQIAADYQSRPLGGGGFMRIVRFFPDRDAFSVHTYSPYLEQHLTDEPNQFEYDRLGIFTPGNGQYQVDAANAVARMTLLSHDEPSTSLAVKKVFAYGKPPEIEKLAVSSGLVKHPSFKLGPTQQNIDKILSQMKATPPNYPYDFRLASISKCQEEGLTFDRHAGGDNSLGQNDYYFPATVTKFGGMEGLRAHVAGLYEHFLDFSWADTWAEAEEYAKKLPESIKTDPVWV